MKLTDSHCHLDFFADPLAILAAARGAGVPQIILPAVSRSRWQNVAYLAENKGIFPTYGLHPLYSHQREDIAALKAFLQENQAIAIGECGLDFQQGEDPQQIDFFAAQLKIAAEMALPVIVHARKSLDKVLQLIARAGTPRFVIHSFTGSDVQLQRILALGGYVGIGGTSTYPRAQRLRRQLAELPADRFLLETDAPDQPICGRQGKENKPEYLIEIAENLANLRQTSRENIAHQNEKNCAQFFVLPEKH